MAFWCAHVRPLCAFGVFGPGAQGRVRVLGLRFLERGRVRPFAEAGRMLAFAGACNWQGSLARCYYNNSKHSTGRSIHELA